MKRGPVTAGRYTPQFIFAIVAFVAGAVLAALIAPVAGGNEEMNLQRAASLASGYALVGPAELPGGMADLLAATHKRYPEGASPPYSYSREEFDRLAALPLQKAEPKTVIPNPIAVLHPISYLPQVPAIKAAELLNVRPLWAFYIARLAGLVAGITLTFFAIRIMPVHKHLLAAVALLPPMLFSRSTLDADQFTNGLAFLFLAMVIREMLADGPIRAARLAGIAIAAFILAQSKSAYLLLPLFALAIPAARFPSLRHKLSWCAVIAVPGILVSLAWMIVLKSSYFNEIVYYTWSGTVRPKEQFDFIAAHPLQFAVIMLRTVFTTAFIPNVLIDFIGVFGPPVRIPVLFLSLVGMMLAMVGISEGQALRISAKAKALAACLVLATVVIILTLLYLQWTRYRGPVIDGFNGRYLYPMVPLLLILLPKRTGLEIPPAAVLAVFGIVTTGLTWFVTWQTYWA